MNRVALNLGIIKIYWYSIFILLGMVIASIIIYKEGIKKGIKKEKLINIIINTIIISVIGARVYYVLFNLDYYLNNPVEIIKVWNGGLAIHGGIITGIVAVIYQCRKEKIDTLRLLDIIVVGVIIGQAIGRWGNFFNQEAYGNIASLTHLNKLHIPKFIIDGMLINGKYREPTFLYESVFNLIGFIILLLLRKKSNLKKGQLTGFYFMWYSVVRFLIEIKRSDSLMLGSIKMAMLVSVFLFITGLFLFIYYDFIKKEKENLY